MNSLTINGKTTVCGIEVPKIAGGFGLDKPVMLAKTVAELHQMELKAVNQAINKNRSRFRDGIDVIDLKNSVNQIDPLLQAGALSKQSVANSQNIYLLSRIGYGKLLKIFNDDLAWDKYERILEEYFELKEPGTKVPQSFAEALRLAADMAERNETLKLQNAQQHQIICEMKPKATYYDVILQSKAAIPITKIAKDYGMSAVGMNNLLHDLKVQFKNGDTWLLYQDFAAMGYTASKTHCYINSQAEPCSKLHTYWTQKGRLFIYDLLKSKRGILPLMEHSELALIKTFKNR